MSIPKIAKAMEYIDDDLVSGAAEYRRTAKKNAWIGYGAAAACLCLVLAGAFGRGFFDREQAAVPHPAAVRVVNPIITVASVEEMERYLDFHVPVLDKEAEAYTVLVADSYPTMGQIHYTDGSCFRMRYGNGDISGIYGGSFVETKDIDGVKAEFYRYADTAYAIWEQNGFAFSYSYTDGDGDAENAIRQMMD